jgi:hypothetical protein
VPGLEAIQLIVGPMANSLDDLTEFWKRVFEMEPWQYDHTVDDSRTFTHIKLKTEFDVLNTSVSLSHGGRSTYKQRKNG